MINPAKPERMETMKYCKTCQRLYGDEHSRCEQCGKALLPEWEEGAPVCIATADGFEVMRIESALGDAGIPCVHRPVKKNPGGSIITGNATGMVDVCVPYAALPDAVDVLIGIGALEPGSELAELAGQVQQGEGQAEGERFAELDPKKRTLWRVVSVVVLIALIFGVVFLTDTIIALIKQLVSGQ